MQALRPAMDEMLETYRRTGSLGQAPRPLARPKSHERQILDYLRTLEALHSSPQDLDRRPGHVHVRMGDGGVASESELRAEIRAAQSTTRVRSEWRFRNEQEDVTVLRCGTVDPDYVDFLVLDGRGAGLTARAMRIDRRNPERSTVEEARIPAR